MISIIIMARSGNEIKVEKVDFPDKKLIHIGIVQANELVEVNIKQILYEPVKNTDILQDKIGNCYFLVSLGLLIDKYPQVINQLCKVNNFVKPCKVEVTLHDVNNINKIYIYALDPTKVVKKESNKHAHDLIFIMEKAYAIHRIYTEPMIFSEREKYLKEVYAKNDNDIVPTLESLEREEKAKEKQISEKINYLETQHKANPNFRDEMDKEIYSLLYQNSGSKEEVISAFKKRLNYKDFDQLRSELYKLKLKTQTEKTDYLSALTAGLPSSSMKALCGNDSEELLIEQQPTLEYLLGGFLPSLHSVSNEKDLEKLDHESKKVLTDIFGALDSAETIYFLQCVKSIDPDVFLQLLNEFINTKPKPDAHTLLKKIFAQLVEPLAKAEPNLAQFAQLAHHTYKKISDYIDTSVPYGRGIGKYTVQEQLLFNKINADLKFGKLIALVTNKNIGNLTTEKEYKGLFKGHAYQVVNCIERDRFKFLLLRNPHGSDVRDYEFEGSHSDEKKSPRLRAKAKKQIENPGKISQFLLGSPKSPRSRKISSTAIPLETELNKSGFFEFEICDLKNVEYLHISDPPELKQVSAPSDFPAKRL